MIRALGRIGDGLPRNFRPLSLFDESRRYQTNPRSHTKLLYSCYKVLHPVTNNDLSSFLIKRLYAKATPEDPKPLTENKVISMGEHVKAWLTNVSNVGTGKCDFCSCASCFREMYQVQPRPSLLRARYELVPGDSSQDRALGKDKIVVMEKALHLPFIFTCCRCGQNRVLFACSGGYKSYHFPCALKDSICGLNLEKLILLCPEDIYLREIIQPKINEDILRSWRSDSSPSAEISEPRRYYLDSYDPFEVPAPGLFGREKVYALRISYLEGHGFIIHGLWAGEMINGKPVYLKNFVEVNIYAEQLFRALELQVHKLPPDVTEFLKRHWFDQNCSDESHKIKYLFFWIRQVLKHATEGDNILVKNYFRTVVQLAKPVLESLEKIVKKMNFEDLHHCENFRLEISREFGKQVSMTLKESKKQDISSDVPKELTFLFTQECEKIDMPHSYIPFDRKFHF